MTDSPPLSHQATYTISDHGAIGDGAYDNTQVIQQLLDRCAAQGGGTVIVPAGHYVIGPLHMRSHVELHLASGALLQAHTDISAWPLIDDPYSSGQSENKNMASETLIYAPILYGNDLEQVAITGTGRIDGNGAVWWARYQEGTLANRRPRLIGLCGCKRLHIEGITVANSPQWTITPVCCEDVSIIGVRVYNPPHSPNTDGINPDSCRFVRISQCHIDVGDDCITLKAGTEDALRSPMPCEHILISDCTMYHGHGAVVCGSEMSQNIRNVVVQNCIFKGTDRGFRFKTRRGRGGIIENVRASNIIMEDVHTPFVCNLFYRCGAKDLNAITNLNPQPITPQTPAMERLSFSHMTIRNAHTAGIFAYGLPERAIKDLSFDHIDISFADDAKAGVPAMAGHLDGQQMKKVGIYARHVDGLHVDKVAITGYEGEVIQIAECHRANVQLKQ